MLVKSISSLLLFLMLSIDLCSFLAILKAIGEDDLEGFVGTNYSLFRF